MQIQWWGYDEVVGTLKPYLMQKNLFELFTLTDDGHGKTLSASARATWWNMHYLIFIKIYYHIIFVLYCENKKDFEYI